MREMLHLRPEELLANAAGTDTLGACRLVVSHIAVCRECRGERREMDLIAALLLDQQPPVLFSANARARTLAAAAVRPRRST